MRAGSGGADECGPEFARRGGDGDGGARSCRCEDDGRGTGARAVGVLSIVHDSGETATSDELEGFDYAIVMAPPES